MNIRGGILENIIEIIMQTSLAFFAVLFITRLLGRQQVSQLTVYEYINGITFGSVAANMATDLETSTWHHLLGVILFGVLTYIVNKVGLKKRSLSKILQGEPVLVIQNGQILEENLKITGYSLDDINMLLREKDCFTPKDVEYAVLELDGALNIIKVAEKREVTLGDLNLTAEEQSIPTELIIGGSIIYDNLIKRKLTGRDLMEELKKLNIKSVSKVMYATVDSQGEFYVDKFDDDLEAGSDISEDNQGV